MRALELLDIKPGLTEGGEINGTKKFQNKDRDQSRESDSGKEGGFGREPQKMYTAKCSDCDIETEVPFKPDPDRPVYCRQCYAKRKSRNF